MPDKKSILPDTLKPGATGKPIALLVVEDDEVHQELIRNVLSGTDPKFNITFAESVKRAMAVLASQPIDCVLLDHNLPDGSGTQFMEEGEEHLLETPVLAFSTSADPEVALAEFRGGCNGFVLKRDAFRGNALREEIVQTIEKFTARSYRQALTNYARKMSVPKS